MEVVPHPNSIIMNGNHQNNLMSRICKGAMSPSVGLLGLVTCWDTLWR
jgi:hypothetical protein